MAYFAVANGMSTQRLARALGKTANTIRKYELGTLNIPAYLIPMMAEVFGVKIEAFFFETYPKPTHIPDFLPKRKDKT